MQRCIPYGKYEKNKERERACEKKIDKKIIQTKSQLQTMEK